MDREALQTTRAQRGPRTLTATLGLGSTLRKGSRSTENDHVIFRLPPEEDTMPTSARDKPN